MRPRILTDDPSAETNLREPPAEIAVGEELGARKRFGLPVTEPSAG